MEDSPRRQGTKTARHGAHLRDPRAPPLAAFPPISRRFFYTVRFCVVSLTGQCVKSPPIVAVTRSKLTKTSVAAHGQVEILSGKDAGKQGTVLRVVRERNSVIIEGLNLVSGGGGAGGRIFPFWRLALVTATCLFR